MQMEIMCKESSKSMQMEIMCKESSKSGSAFPTTENTHIYRQIHHAIPDYTDTPDQVYIHIHRC